VSCTILSKTGEREKFGELLFFLGGVCRGGKTYYIEREERDFLSILHREIFFNFFFGFSLLSKISSYLHL